MRGFCIAAAAAFLAMSAAPALAQGLDNAKAAVKAATDDELLAEFQRRYGARTSGARSVATRGLTPAPAGGLARQDEASLVRAMRGTTRTIYGTDDRKDFYEVSDETVKALARASVALFDAKDTEAASSAVSLKTKALKQQKKLCSGEKFEAQPSGAFCSGTLVGPDLVLTAGHCVKELSNEDSASALPGVRFVFGYWMKDAATGPGEIPAGQVFSGKDVVGGEFTEKDKDWALVRLDRPVPETVAKPVTSYAVEPVQKNQRVFVIGFPSGIPLKYAPGARVRDNANPAFFVADLDSFGGNSGSGVYDQATKKLIGVLVRGDTDYARDYANNCNRVHVCPRGCRGEDVTRLSLVQFPQ
jgi:V8-like Glu-specific endopeptidase